MQDGPTPREMMARLVAFPTVSDRSNLDLIGFVERYLADLGIASARVPDADGTKASLIARIGPEKPGGVVLSGHTDVVPIAGQDWSTDPFVLTERDGRLYGRGTCDMKGFLACALALAPEMAAAGLTRPILLALSYDEEVGCLGAPEMIERLLAGQPRPEAVIVGEPSMMRVVTGHKASWGFRVHVRGHEVHSSLIHTGVSAVMTAARLVTWMDDAMAANAAAADASDFTPPYTTLHVGVIAGGTASNIAARDCTFSGEIRILPGETVAGWKERFLAEAARLEAAARAVRPEAAITVTTRMEMAGFVPETDGAAERLARALTGDNGRHVVSYQTEAGQFQERGLSTVICGPGSIEQAHQPDEFIAVDQLEA
ncbi:MAG: acetylornithine deacetylase, partial [Rhodobacteraceae bacterium]|nr:acetylornithine deacetylase [Paracoccaceae bacterium]